MESDTHPMHADLETCNPEPYCTDPIFKTPLVLYEYTYRVFLRYPAGHFELSLRMSPLASSTARVF